MLSENPTTGMERITVTLPRREHARTYGFQLTLRRARALHTDMLDISGLNSDGKRLIVGQNLTVSREDLPALLRAIRRIMAGPLERLAIDAEEQSQ